jgi:N-formylmaleamate deformylase
MNGWQSGYVGANGIRLHYWRTGGLKPQMVLAHGLTGNGLCWTRLARVLAPYRDVIMVDARGHGESDKPESGYTPDDHAADLAGVIRNLKLNRPMLMGHSMGGATVTRVAAYHPELVSAIILEDPAWVLGEPSAEDEAERAARAAEWRRTIERRRDKSVAEVVAEGRLEHPTWDIEEFDWWAPAKQQVSLAVFDYVTARRNDWTELAVRIQCPTLLLYGEPSLGGIITPAAAAYARQLNPLIQPRQIPGAGHNVRRENFEDTVAAIQEFFATVRHMQVGEYA